MSEDFMELYVAEERATIFHLDHHVVGKPSSRWSESKTPALPSTKWEQALQSLTWEMWKQRHRHDLGVVCKMWNWKVWHFRVQDIIQGHSQYFKLCIKWHITSGMYSTHWGLRSISCDLHKSVKEMSIIHIWRNYAFQMTRAHISNM